MTDRCDECGQPPEWCRCEAFTIDTRKPKPPNLLPDDDEKATGLANIDAIRRQLKGDK